MTRLPRARPVEHLGIPSGPQAVAWTLENFHHADPADAAATIGCAG